MALLEKGGERKRSTLDKGICKFLENKFFFWSTCNSVASRQKKKM